MNLHSTDLQTLNRLLNGDQAISIENMRKIAVQAIDLHIRLRTAAINSCDNRDIILLLAEGSKTNDDTELMQKAMEGADLEEVEIYLVNKPTAS